MANNIENFPAQKPNIGRLIVLDGTDGSGKNTQAKLLKERLEAEGYLVKTADFPQYNSKSAGLIEEYLSGKYGELEEINPYAASCFYALDRFDMSRQIKSWIKNGYIVLSNRYVTANLAHQGAKISHPLERKAFFDWVENFEYNILRIPRPDITLILRVPARLAQTLANRRQKVDWMGKVRDIHEENLKHLEAAERVFIEISQIYKNIRLVECAQNGYMLDKHAIAENIWQEIKNILPEKIQKTSLAANSERLGAPNFLSVPPALPPILPETAALEKPRIIKLKNPEKKPKYAIDIAADKNYNINAGETVLIKPGYRALLPDNFLGYVLTPKKLLSQNIKIETQILHPGTDSQLAIRLKNNSRALFSLEEGQVLAQIIFHKLEAVEI